jgi:hypothetical protein
MTRTNINQIYKSALVVALCVTFIGATLMFGQMHYFKSVVRAAAIPQTSNSYGEFPTAW